MAETITDGCPPGEGMIGLDDTNYVKILNSETPTLVDACAKWCGPCKLIEPVLQRCTTKYSDSLTMAKYDVESKSPNLKLELLMQDVMPQSLPSLILFRDGKALAKHNGVISDQELEEFIESNLASGGLDGSSAEVNAASDEQATSSAPEKKKAGFVSFTTDRDDYMLGGDV